MTASGSPRAPRRQALFAVIAIGLVMGGSAAWAQDAPAPAPSRADTAADNDPADAVVIHGQRYHRPRTYGVPPDKAAAFAGKDAAWREYRDSTPAPMPGACPVPPDPAQGAGCGTLQGSKDYPGLGTYLPQ